MATVTLHLFTDTTRTRRRCDQAPYAVPKPGWKRAELCRACNTLAGATDSVETPPRPSYVPPSKAPPLPVSEHVVLEPEIVEDWPKIKAPKRHQRIRVAPRPSDPRSEPQPIKVGQVWQSTDRRDRDTPRQIFIEDLDEDGVHVWVRNVETKKLGRIKKARLKPCSTGYRLVES